MTISPLCCTKFTCNLLCCGDAASQFKSLSTQIIHSHSLPSTELRHSRPSRRRSGAAGRGRCPGREPSSGNYGASGGTRRTKRTCGAPVTTCCSSPFRANFQRMREFCSEKVCFPVTRPSPLSSDTLESRFSIPDSSLFSNS